MEELSESPGGAGSHMVYNGFIEEAASVLRWCRLKVLVIYIDEIYAPGLSHTHSNSRNKNSGCALYVAGSSSFLSAALLLSIRLMSRQVERFGLVTFLLDTNAGRIGQSGPGGHQLVTGRC